MKTYYDVLGVPETASEDDIKKAYRLLAMKHHPDRNQGDASAVEKFKDVAEAYEVLGDKDNRARYDRNHRPVSSHVYADIFGGHTWNNGEIPTRGDDVLTTIYIDLQDIFQDTKKPLSYTRKDYCSICVGKGCKPGKSKGFCASCKGSGRVGKGYGNNQFRLTEYMLCGACEGSGKRASDADKCEPCNGFGTKQSNHTLNITIPRGMPPGRSLIFRQEGCVGRYGGPRGDLRVNVLINPTPFRRDPERPHNLIYLMGIPYWKAVLGGNQQVQMPDGTPLTVVIPKLCKNGHVERVMGAGLPVFGRSERGDLKIMFEIKMPEHATPEFTSLVERMRELEEKENDEKANHVV